MTSAPALPENYRVKRIADSIRATSPKASDYQAVFERATLDGAFVLESGTALGGPYVLSIEDLDRGLFQHRITELFPKNEAALVRLRGRFTGAQLADMKIRSAKPTEIEQNREIHVTWKGRSAAGAVGLFYALACLRRFGRRRAE